ncbi:uncharacterized protein LOC111286255 [Durio zibethinus]|uniref:Uncharacterized protein LOC111286255 n=1 Tax=Durio zibethinus TaxID=66656 RepID=A0A6P5XUI1_DURZI|nr:uncharacterized protein LOC111286255 [Durio zibethinus]
MASWTIRCMALIMVIEVLILGGRSQVSGQEECGNLVGLGVLFGCQNFIEKEKPKVAPSADCCKALKSIGMECTCKLITKEIEQIISMEKLVYVAGACGQPIPQGTYCGSYKVPATP